MFKICLLTSIRDCSGLDGNTKRHRLGYSLITQMTHKLTHCKSRHAPSVWTCTFGNMETQTQIGCVSSQDLARYHTHRHAHFQITAQTGCTHTHCLVCGWNHLWTGCAGSARKPPQGWVFVSKFMREWRGEKGNLSGLLRPNFSAKYHIFLHSSSWAIILSVMQQQLCTFSLLMCCMFHSSATCTN